MSFIGNEDHSITLDEAGNLTRNYRNKTGEGAIKAEFFGKEVLQNILTQENCVGIRVYYGQKDNGTPVLVLIGADANGNDLTQGIIAERGLPCPPFCPENSALIS